MPDKNPHLAIDLPMVGDIYTSREALDNLIILCDDFGSRFPGTPEELQAVDFIAERFASYGLNNVHREEYPYEGWSRGPASLEIVEPIQRTIPCISLPYCPSSDITADLVSVGCGSPAEYEELGKQMEGQIVMAQSASPPELGRWVHRKEKYERAVLGGASAFLFVSEHPGVGPETGSLQTNQMAPIPGISVCKEDGAFLLRLMERRGSIRLRIHTTDSGAARTSWNVVGELPGKGQPDQLVVVGCHYDGHDIAQGAVDPISGMVALMEAARVLSAHAKDKLAATVRFIAFGTEEIGLTGARQYIAAHEPEMAQIRFMLNLDAGGREGRKGVVLHHWPELGPLLRQAADEMASEMPVGQKMHSYSDHFPFFLQGVPTAHMGDPGSAPAGRGFGHTAYDTVDKVKLADLREASSVAARVVLRLAALKDFPVQRRDPQSVQHILDTDPNLEGYRVYQRLSRQA